MSQEQGLIGKLVGAMIRRSVRLRFRNVYLQMETPTVVGPAILYANHNGWMDGYLMLHLVQRLGLRCVDWIEEFDAFPLFSRVGGMRFTKGEPTSRAKTIRQTIRLMKDKGWSLVLFPEGVLHRPGTILNFGRAIEVVARAVPSVVLVPVGIRYDMSIHERPEAWMRVGTPHSFVSLEDCQARVEFQLAGIDNADSKPEGFEVLQAGTADVNERMDMRRIPRR